MITWGRDMLVRTLSRNFKKSWVTLSWELRWRPVTSAVWTWKGVGKNLGIAVFRGQVWCFMLITISGVTYTMFLISIVLSGAIARDGAGRVQFTVHLIHLVTVNITWAHALRSSIMLFFGLCFDTVQRLSAFRALFLYRACRFHDWFFAFLPGLPFRIPSLFITTGCQCCTSLAFRCFSVLVFLVL